MGTFEKALEKVLMHEGGFVNHPNDPGGATNFGMSLRYLLQRGDLDGDGWLDGDLDRDGDIDTADIQNMTKEQAADLYRHIWQKSGAWRFEAQLISTKVFDMAVNMGGRQAVKILQRAARACGNPLLDDGLVGAKTIQAVNKTPWPQLLPAIKAEQAGFYRGLVMKDKKYAPFLLGWLKRAYSQ